ncbi:MAG: hypothetical protein H7832_15070 [Magnetococcus sp. DMHC-6]
MNIYNHLRIYLFTLLISFFYYIENTHASNINSDILENKSAPIPTILATPPKDSSFTRDPHPVQPVSGGSKGLITSNWDEFFNISRLQIRTNGDGKTSYTQSTFIRFPFKIFLAQVYEHTTSYDGDPHFNYFELNVGSPITDDKYYGKLFGWVCRDQEGTGFSSIVSCGMQYNFSDHKQLDDFRKDFKLTSFVQIFPIKNNDKLGNIDIVHYYSFKIYDEFYVRGYNNWFQYDHDKDYWRFMQDFIQPLNSNFDLYLRHTWQNRKDIQFGHEGSDLAVGIRFNFKL